MLVVLVLNGQTNFLNLGCNYVKQKEITRDLSSMYYYGSAGKNIAIGVQIDEQRCHYERLQQ